MDPVTKNRLLAVARAVCEEHDWPWTEPVIISTRWRKYVIMTNAGAMGQNVWIDVDRKSLRVLRAALTPR